MRAVVGRVKTGLKRDRGAFPFSLLAAGGFPFPLALVSLAFALTLGRALPREVTVSPAVVTLRSRVERVDLGLGQACRGL